MYMEAIEVFREFKQAGLKANVVLYSALIDALSKNGMVESTVSMLDEMTKEGIRLNVVTNNSIIDAFGRSAAIESVAYDAIETHELQLLSLPTSTTKESTENEVAEKEENHVINIFGQLTETESHAKNRCRKEILCILGVFQKMHELKIKPNIVTFSTILNACSRCNSFEDASMLLEELRMLDNKVYGVAHGLLMGCRHNVWVQAQYLFDEVKLKEKKSRKRRGKKNTEG